MRPGRAPFRLQALLALFVGTQLAGACAKEPQPPPTSHRPQGVALLLAQAQFEKKEGPGGDIEYVPLPSKLTLVHCEGASWRAEVLEDPDGNVFHKAMPYRLAGRTPGILTISANEAPLPAHLKLWRRRQDGWRAVVLSGATFGGKFNRFRDVEIGDVTGDGKPNIIVGTHDRGIVFVLSEKKPDEPWKPKVIDRAPVTFIHEIEVGDVDGDGRAEIFATPSAPNKGDGKIQPGRVVMYRFVGGAFRRRVVEAFADRHVKEILLADIEGTGRPDLFAAVEPQLGPNTAAADGHTALEIRRYRFTAGKPVGTTLTTLPDKKCRFLDAGDVDADGQAELVASTYRSGIWLIKRDGESWKTRLIDRDSSGYEHALCLADMDGDGTPEIYVAADDQGWLRQYRWTGSTFQRTDLMELSEGDITFCIVPCFDAACLSVH